MVRVAVRSAGKAYHRYAHKWGPVLKWVAGRGYTQRTEWALRDVTFEAEAGESVGIIGLNGAGKSTLLKLLAGVTQPTEGSITLNGTTAAMLELGLGMHPDLTGWQNATLLCQLMGFSSAVVQACLPQIRDFAELGEHMAHPVRTYSTGMHLRLAFSAATAVRPEILIVDEALAVGYTYFQQKALRRIRTFREAGTTLLFVTHDPVALKAVCTRALLLDCGRLVRDGPVSAVWDYYNALIAAKRTAGQISQIIDDAGRVVTRSGNKAAEVVSLELCDAAGAPRRVFQVGETARIDCRVGIRTHIPAPTIGFVIRDRVGTDVFGTNTYYLGVAGEPCAPDETLNVTFEIALHVGPGTYSISVSVHHGPSHLDENYDWWDKALLFEVIPSGACLSVGVAALPTRVSVRRTAADVAVQDARAGR